MPIVEYNCPEGHGKFEVFHKMEDEYKAFCPVCKRNADRVWSSFSFNFDFRPGWDPGLGEYVDTKKQREEFVREKNLVRIKD